MCNYPPHLYLKTRKLQCSVAFCTSYSELVEVTNPRDWSDLQNQNPIRMLSTGFPFHKVCHRVERFFISAHFSPLMMQKLEVSAEHTQHLVSTFQLNEKACGPPPTARDEQSSPHAAFSVKLETFSTVFNELGILDKLLTPIILLFMILGVVIGEYAPQVKDALDTVKIHKVSARECRCTDPTRCHPLTLNFSDCHWSHCHDVASPY